MAGGFLITSKRCVRKTCARAFSAFLLLVIGIAGIGVASPVHAAEQSSAHAPEQGVSEVLVSGRSGSCVWKYIRTNGEVILTIAPVNGEEGALSPYAGARTGEFGFFPGDEGMPVSHPDEREGRPDSYAWNFCLDYQEITKRVLVKGRVKVPSNAEFMFRDFKEAESFDLRGLDVSYVTIMEGMFSGCSAVTSLDLSSWNVSGVKSTRSMFSRCSALTSLDVSGWDLSNVRDPLWMFSECAALTSLDLSHWNILRTWGLEGMFAGCSALTSLNLSGWDVSYVTDMRGMFFGCHALTSLDMSGWDVSHVTDMYGMFTGCRALTSLSIDSWDVSHVTNMYGMFAGCFVLTSLNVSSWDVSHVRDMSFMFAECAALTSLDLSSWKVSDENEMKNMFAGMQSLKTITLGTGFLIDDTAAFGDAGSSAGTNWRQVDLGYGGTEANPKGKVFESPSELLAFHRGRTLRKTDVETYVRVIPSAPTSSFDKGAEDITGEATSRSYNPGAAAPLTKNAYSV